MDRVLTLVAAATVTAALWLVPVSAFGQSKAAYTPPKSAWDGHADLSGIWQAPASAGNNLQSKVKGKNIIVDPKDGKIPYLPAALAKKKENDKNRAADDPVNKCYMPGVPRLTYLSYPIQIFQTAKYVILVSEYAHVYRTIYTDGSEHIDGLDFWDGDSRGHWEGDTLVVDVGSFNDQTWFDKVGDYHSDELHVVERFTRTAPDVLTYEATITDPKTFSKPWTISLPLKLHTEPNFRLMEFECQDEANFAARGGQ